MRLKVEMNCTTIDAPLTYSRHTARVRRTAPKINSTLRIICPPAARLPARSPPARLPITQLRATECRRYGAQRCSRGVSGVLKAAHICVAEVEVQICLCGYAIRVVADVAHNCKAYAGLGGSACNGYARALAWMNYGGGESEECKCDRAVQCGGGRELGRCVRCWNGAERSGAG